MVFKPYNNGNSNAHCSLYMWFTCKVYNLYLLLLGCGLVVTYHSMDGPLMHQAKALTKFNSSKDSQLFSNPETPYKGLQLNQQITPLFFFVCHKLYTSISNWTKISLLSFSLFVLYELFIPSTKKKHMWAFYWRNKSTKLHTTKKHKNKLPTKTNKLLKDLSRKD